ncbi:hypothetical protein Zm00014a_010086, partial [Zea mays]
VFGFYVGLTFYSILVSKLLNTEGN